MSLWKDDTGKSYERWLILYFSTKTHLWTAQCICGVIKEVNIADIRNGSSKSCGCLRTETTVKRFTTHGYGSQAKGLIPEYNTWLGMKQRCYNKKCACYSYYGGRGIRVCKRWKHSFSNFLADMGRKPGPDYSIDRINVNGNYEPSNCRWATKKEQAINTRRSRARV